jgi:hypothetical protein
MKNQAINLVFISCPFYATQRILSQGVPQTRGGFMGSSANRTETLQPEEL